MVTQHSTKTLSKPPESGCLMLEAGTEPSWQQLTFWKRWCARVYTSRAGARRRSTWCLLMPGPGPPAIGPLLLIQNTTTTTAWCLLLVGGLSAAARPPRVPPPRNTGAFYSVKRQFSSRLSWENHGQGRTILMCPTDGRCLMCRCRGTRGLRLAI